MEPPAIPRVTMAEAPTMIRDLLAQTSRRPRVVGITGPVGSGKSTLASRVSTCVIPTDAYLPDYHTLPEHDRDLPEHADLELLAAHINELRAQGEAMIPVWSFHTHRREGSRQIVCNHDTIVVEGIHALNEKVLSHLDLAVVVDSSPSTRWARWEAIESSGERGWGVERARIYFETVAEPTFHALARDYYSRAGLIVIND